MVHASCFKLWNATRQRIWYICDGYGSQRSSGVNCWCLRRYLFLFCFWKIFYSWTIVWADYISKWALAQGLDDHPFLGLDTNPGPMLHLQLRFYNIRKKKVLVCKGARYSKTQHSHNSTRTGLKLLWKPSHQKQYCHTEVRTRGLSVWWSHSKYLVDPRPTYILISRLS